MNPNQNPAPGPQNSYPPQTPPQGYPSAQPQPSYVPPQQQTGPVQQPGYPQSQQAAAPQQASWYTPPVNPNADRPADANSYLQAAGVSNTPTTPTQPIQVATVPGQTVNGQYTVDYLNKVAPAGSGTPSQSFDKKFLYVGIGLGAALILAAGLFFMQPKKTSDDTSIRLYSTLIDTQKTISGSGKLLKNSNLQAFNSTLGTHLANATRDMETPLTKTGKEPSALKTAATKPPYHDKKLVTTLEEARLNGIYDREYANQMDTKLQYIILYMETIKKRSKAESMQAFVNKNLPNFKSSHKTVSEWRKSEEATRY